MQLHQYLFAIVRCSYFAGSGVTLDYEQAIIQASSGDQEFMQHGTIEVYDFGACVIQDGAERVVSWAAVREIRLSSEKPS